MRAKQTALVGLASAAALAVAVVLPTHAASAASLSAEKSLEQQLTSAANSTDSQISHEKMQVQTLQSQIQQEQVSLSNIESAINQNRQQTAHVTAQIQTLQAELKKNEAKLQADKTALTEQIRSIYENGHVSYLSVLMQATSFDDLLSRMYMLQQVTKAQKHLVNQVTDLQNSIQKQEQQQKAQYAMLAQKNAQLQTYQKAEQILQAAHQTALASVKTNMQAQQRRRTLLESQIHLTQQQIQQIQYETALAQKVASNPTNIARTSAGMPQVNAQALIQFGEQFMGLPYVWGGTSPTTGFDCSGFVQYVYAHFGVSLQRTSEAQFGEGVPVSESNLQPGDLVFFSTYAPGASHVGIYIGNGMMLDSEDMGLVIDSIHNSYWGPKYLGARRVIK